MTNSTGREDALTPSDGGSLAKALTPAIRRSLRRDLRGHGLLLALALVPVASAGRWRRTAVTSGMPTMMSRDCDLRNLARSSAPTCSA